MWCLRLLAFRFAASCPIDLCHNRAARCTAPMVLGVRLLSFICIVNRSRPLAHESFKVHRSYGRPFLADSFSLVYGCEAFHPHIPVLRLSLLGMPTPCLLLLHMRPLRMPCFRLPLLHLPLLHLVLLHFVLLHLELLHLPHLHLPLLRLRFFVFRFIIRH